MNVTDHRKRHRGPHAKNWNRGKSLAADKQESKELVINTSQQPSSPAPPLVVNTMGSTAPRLRKGSTVLSQSPSNLSSNLQKFQYFAQQRGVQMTRLMNPNSPATTNSLWPLVQDFKVKYPANRGPQKLSSPRMGKTYAQYNNNNGIGGVRRVTSNSPQQSFGNSTKLQNSGSRLFGVQSPNEDNNVNFQLFEPTSYGIKIEGKEAPLNRKYSNYQPSNSTLIADRLNQEVNQFLESKAFPNLTARNHNHVSPMHKHVSSLSGKQETEFNHGFDSHINNDRNTNMNTLPHGTNSNQGSEQVIDEQGVDTKEGEQKKHEQTLLNSVNQTYSKQFLMEQYQPPASSMSQSNINIPSPNENSRADIQLKVADQMNLSAEKFKQKDKKQSRMKISIKKSPKRSRASFSPPPLSHQSNSPTISPQIRSPTDALVLGNTTGINFKPSLIMTQPSQFMNLKSNVKIVRNNTLESQESPFLKGEADVDFDINRFPELDPSQGFEHLKLSQSMLLENDDDDEEVQSRRSSNDIYDDTVGELDESNTLVIEQSGNKQSYQKYIDSIIINIDRGPKRLNNKLILGCFSDMDWKIFSQQKIDRVKYGEDLLWSEKPFSYRVFNSMKSYQMINQFPRMHHISKSDNLIQNLQKMKNMFPRDYKIFPKTWFIPQDTAALKQYCQNQSNFNGSNYSSGYFKFNQGPVFIIKPLQKKKQIKSKIVESYDDIEETIIGPMATPETFGENPIDGPMVDQAKYVVQSYIKNPLLIDGRKFDMRFYVLVTSCNPLTVFVHRQGFTRIAKQKYTQGHFENKDIHRTSENTQAASFPTQIDQNLRPQNMGTIEDGFQTLRKRGFNTQNMKTMIHDVIIKTLLSIQPDMLHNYKVAQPNDTEFDMCFQILSFDMVIDQSRRPWLVHFDSNPDLSQSFYPLENRIKRFIIMDTLKLLNLTVAEKEKRLQFNEQLQKQKSQLQKIKQDGAKFSITKMQAKNMRSRKLDHWSNNLGGYDWVFPIGKKKVGITQNAFSEAPNIRDTHYISPDSNVDRSEIGGGAFNFKLAGQTSLGQTNTMANLNAHNETALLGNKSSNPQAYGSSNNLMQTIPQFPSANPGSTSQISNGHRTLKVGSENIAAPAITQVRIKRVNNLEKQDDTALESGGDNSSIEHNTNDKMANNPELSARQNKEGKNPENSQDLVQEETLDFKNLQDAQNYYNIFQKTMTNISQKKKSQLMSPAQIMERNFIETMRNSNTKANLRFELANPSPLSKSPSSKFQMYLNANKTGNMGIKSHPKFEQMVQKRVMDNEKNHKLPASPSIYNLVRQTDDSPPQSEYYKTQYEHQRSLQLSRFQSIPKGWNDNSNESMTDISPFSQTLKQQQLQALRFTGSSPDEIIEMASQNHLDESQLYDYIFKNPEFKMQMHNDQIQQLVQDFQQKYGNKKVEKKPLQQQLMHQVVSRSPVQPKPSPGRVMQRTYQNSVNQVNNQSPDQTYRTFERSNSNQQSPSSTVYYGQKPQQQNAWLKRMQNQVAKKKNQTQNATTFTNMDKLSEMQELKKQLLNNSSQFSNIQSRHVINLPGHKSNGNDAQTQYNPNNQNATRNIVAQNYHASNIDTTKSKGAVDTQEHSVNASVEQTDRKHDNLDMNHLLILNQVDSQVLIQERQNTDSISQQPDQSRNQKDTIKTLNKSQHSKTLLGHQLSSKKLLMDHELSMTKGEIPEGPIKYSNLLSPINSLQKTQLQAPSSHNEYRRQGSFEGRQSKDLNLNDVSVESLMNASLNKDGFNESVHQTMPLKSPILKAAKIFENSNLHAQYPQAIKLPAPEIKNIKSFPTEGEEGSGTIGLSKALTSGPEPEKLKNQLKLELKEAGPAVQPNFAAIQSTTQLGSQSIINADSVAQLNVSESMINHVIHDNMNKTISPSYLNSSNPRLFPVIYNNEQNAVFGARSRSVIPNITSTQFIGNHNKSWYEHKYGYSKNQNRVDYSDVGVKKSEPDHENEVKEQLDTILRSPNGSRLILPSGTNTQSTLFLALNKQRESGASGHKLTMQESPSIGLIKMAARSNSTITSGMKNLKLPQLGKKSYIASSTRDDYENSKITSHEELRQFKKFQQGMLHPLELSAHMKNQIGLRRNKNQNETQVEKILSKYAELKEAQFQNAFSQSSININ